MTHPPFEGPATIDALRKIPLRVQPNVPDGEDGKRAAIPKALWKSQDGAYRHRDRQIEENIRMLAGQQWSVFNPMLGKWVDVSSFMTDDERRWRQRPVFNRLLPWFMLTHARMTENPPIVTFLPGPDRSDADLAETLDTVMKVIYREADVTDAWDRAAAWLICAGSVFMQSRIDPMGGEVIEWRGEAEVPVVDDQLMPVPNPETGEPLMQPAEGVPFSQDGQPLAVLQNQQLVEQGPPHREHMPRIAVDVLSPLEVRGEWGPTAWHEKAWHCSRHILPVEEARQRFNTDVKPSQGTGRDGTGEMRRLLFGTGYYAPSQASNLNNDSSTGMDAEPTVDLYCLWVRPAGLNDPGRYLVATDDGQVLYDGPRPVEYPNTSPIRRWDFARIPGRPTGTSPQDILNTPQRMYNKRYAQLFEHAAMLTHPKPIIDTGSGLRPNQWTSEPSKAIFLKKQTGVSAIEFLSPPPIGQDVWRLLAELREEINDLGNLRGTDGEAPSSEASGELVKELRFNSDRFLGPTLRRAPNEFARMFEDWRAMLPLVYPFERVVSYAGEDNTARTILVRPDLFTQGKVNVIADAESMLPEGRGERQQRVYAMWRDGAFGDPQSPQALRQFYEMMRFPHLSRTAKPGGADRVMAEQENARLMMGEDPQQVMSFEWYDHFVHLEVHEGLMKSPEFLKLSPEVQQAFMMHRMSHMEAIAKMAPPDPPSGTPSPEQPA